MGELLGTFCELEALKLSLYVEGVAVTTSARATLAEMWGRPEITTADYATTSGVTLDLGQDVWVNAPIIECTTAAASSGYVLEATETGFHIRGSMATARVRPIPVPQYQGRLNRWGEPFTRYVNTHADRVRISPVVGCANGCQFCDVPSLQEYRLNPIDRILDAVDVALNDPVLPPRHILISGGTPRPENYRYLHDTYEAISDAFAGWEIDVMMTPATGLLDPESLLNLGIHGICANLELYGENAARQIVPEKSALTRGHYLNFIARAVDLFGIGRVRSLLLLGLEDLESTMAGVEALAERGCDPVLSPFRPHQSTPLRFHAPPTYRALRDAVVGARRVLSRFPGVMLGPRCRPCSHNAIP